jgi:uncharacterized protein (TIGR02452 family)
MASSRVETWYLANIDYYHANRADRSVLYTDHAIWSPRVPVFRDDKGSFLPKPVLSNFITIPAPNTGEYLSRHGAPGRSAAKIDAVVHRRMDIIFGLARKHNVKTIILGAWGCGVFGNDPEIMAWAFRSALQRWPMERAVFAVYGGGTTYETFRNVLGV